MHGTSKCFYNDGSEVVDQLVIGRKIDIISSVPADLPEVPALVYSQLTLKDAVKLDFALHVGEDSILIHNKKIWISACEKTYHKAGLEMRKLKGRYFLQDDIESMNKRLKWALATTLTEPLEFLIQNGHSEPAYHHNSFETPPLRHGEDEFDDWAPHVYEWFGLVSLNSPVLKEHQNQAICNYFSYPESSLQPLHIYSVEGLITPSFVRQLLKGVKPQDWLAVSVHGFNHSPMAWNRPHHWDQGSEYGYSVLKTTKESSFKLISRGDL